MDQGAELAALRKENECLRRENIRLLDNLQQLRARADSLWECIEDVAIGIRPECPKCGKPRPCLCMDRE